MEYIDFTAQRLHLHNNCKRAIVDLMKEVEVTKIKLDGEALLYKGRNTEGEVDEDWQKLEISDNVISATIDSVYEAVWLRLKK